MPQFSPHFSHTILDLALLVAAGAADAHTTVTLRQRIVTAGGRPIEYNPLLRPIVPHPDLVAPAIIGGDLAVYGLLRKLNKPRAAKWFARGEAMEDLACAWSNMRQHPMGQAPLGPLVPFPVHPVAPRRIK